MRILDTKIGLPKSNYDLGSPLASNFYAFILEFTFFSCFFNRNLVYVWLMRILDTKIGLPKSNYDLGSPLASNFYAFILEFTFFSCFFNRNCNCNSHTNHWVVTCTDKTHHFYVSRYRRRTSELCIRVHTS